MKKHLLLISSVLMIILVAAGCSSKVDTKITFNNISASNLLINFRGSIVNVPTGKVVSLNAVPQGTYNYATTYSVPGNFKSNTSGDVSGSVVIGVATKIQILYSSTLVDSSYTLFATISSSEDQNPTTTGP